MITDSPPNPSLSVAMLALIGKPISAASTDNGYVHLEFLSATISVLTRMYLSRENQKMPSDHSDFAAALSACIGNQVISIQEHGDYIFLYLSSKTTLEINLADPTAGPESFIYQNSEGQLWIT